MAIVSSGAISLASLQSEFGGSNPISLSEYYRGGSYTTTLPTSKNGSIPTSGSISIGSFYGSVKYTSGSASWYTIGSYSWTAPAWCEKIYVSGTGGGAGGGQMADEGCIHDAGAAGGGSSGQMCSNYALSVTPSSTYGVTVGAGGGDHAAGGSSSIASLTLAGGNPGQGGGACSYFYNGHYYSAGSYTRGTNLYGYDGAGPGGGYSTVQSGPWDDGYGYQYYYTYDQLYYVGGAGGAGWGGTGGGAGGRTYDGGGGSWGSTGTSYGAGGGGGAAGNINGGGYAGGGSGAQGFISITW